MYHLGEWKVGSDGAELHTGAPQLCDNIQTLTTTDSRCKMILIK